MKNYVSWLKRLKFACHLYKTGPQQIPSETFQKYPKDSTFDGKHTLNLGCGTSVFPAKNVINLDFCKAEGVNIIWDLSKTPLPFKNEEFDFIIANHVLEHIPDWWECFKELARIVKVGGIIEVWLPGDGGSSQLGYRDHLNTINKCSFVGIRDTWRNYANIWERQECERSGYVKDLKRVNAAIRMIDFWWVQLLSETLLQWCGLHLRNVVSEQGWFFKKLSPNVKSNEN